MSLAGHKQAQGKRLVLHFPLLQLLSERTPTKGKRKIRALILTPTRELAAQVGGECQNVWQASPI